MKKPLLLLVSLVIFINTQAWELFGPADIVATNICFAELPYEGAIICTDDGMYLNDENSLQWDHYSEAGLPVVEGIFLETETILVVMGNGSYSDGIYSFNASSGQFSVIEYCLEPSFLRFNPNTSKYYVGYSGGLLVSEDAANWSEESYFSGKNCQEMAFDYVHLLVTVDELPPNVHRSENGGDSWQTSSSLTPIFRMASWYGPNFFGMCPFNTSLSGFYTTQDGGNNWDFEFAADHVSDISYDANGFLLISWNNPGAGYQGLAIYEPGSGTAGLNFINDGLPDTHINRVKQREGIDIRFAYVCTPTGVYHTVFVGIKPGSKLQSMVYPNPLENHRHLTISFTSKVLVHSVQLFTLSGKLLYELPVNKQLYAVKTPVNVLLPGIYLANVNTPEGAHRYKIVVK